MKVGRRAFVQFIAGAVGGSLLTPIPWKLADDSAIWSQNWSWRPSPARGEITKVNTTCGLCPGGCGITAHLVDKKRAIALQGNPDHPINAGGICPLGASGLQFLYAPYRIAQPLKQTGKRGDPNGFRPITWEAALAEVQSQLSHLRTEGKPHQLACITGQRQSSMKDLWQQFCNSFGSPNFFLMPSGEDSLRQAALAALGHPADLTFRLEEASYVLSFGADLLEGWGAPGRLQALFGSWYQEGGATSKPKFVQVEARCSMSAAKADQWIAIKPGSEAALALGIAHALIRDRLYDSEFVQQQCFGFEPWTDAKGVSRKGFKEFVTTQYPPGKVADMTGVPEATINSLAKELASQKRAVVVWGKGKGSTPNNLYHDLAFLALNALVGNLKPGGLVGLKPDVPLGALPKVPADGVAEKGLRQARLDLTRSTSPALPGNALHSFLDCVRDKPAYPIDVLMIHEANPAYSLTENQLLAAAVEKISLVVSYSSYMDETTMLADLVLPNHMALERLDDVVGLPAAPYAYYALATPILKPQLSTRHTGDILLELGKSLGGSVQASLPWGKYQDYLMDRVKGLAATGRGTMAESVRAEPWRTISGEVASTQAASPSTQDSQSEATQPRTVGKAKGDSDFWKKLVNGMCWYDGTAGGVTEVATPSGRYEFACQVILTKKPPEANDDSVCMPQFRLLPPSGDDKEYPLLLVTYPLMTLAEQYLANPPFMTKNLREDLLKGHEMFVEVHPETAKNIGIGEAGRATLKTPQGRAVSVLVHLSQGARPGIVFIPQGLGHTAYDEYIRGKGENANRIVEVQIDPLTGLGTVWATRAQLRRA